VLLAGESVRQCYAKLRKTLTKKGTKSAKRKLRKVSGKEARTKRDINHYISKALVKKAKDTKRGIVLEDLTGLQSQTTVRRSQRARHHSWSYYQLRQFIVYKAALSGVPAWFVNPVYTSQKCSKCGHITKKNRKTRDTFLCVRCNFKAPADYNAAINLSIMGNPIDLPNAVRIERAQTR